MFSRNAQGLTYRLLNQLSRSAPAGCQINAAAAAEKTTKSQPPCSGANPDVKAQGAIKITQRIGLFDYTAEYKEGSLEWCTTDKHADPAESEGHSAKSKSSVLAWIQRRYRYASFSCWFLSRFACVDKENVNEHSFCFAGFKRTKSKILCPLSSCLWAIHKLSRTITFSFQPWRLCQCSL